VGNRRKYIVKDGNGDPLNIDVLLAFNDDLLTVPKAQALACGAPACVESPVQLLGKDGIAFSERSSLFAKEVIHPVAPLHLDVLQCQRRADGRFILYVFVSVFNHCVADHLVSSVPNFSNSEERLPMSMPRRSAVAMRNSRI
jgi:hypothetical protein